MFSAARKTLGPDGIIRVELPHQAGTPAAVSRQELGALAVYAAVAHGSFFFSRALRRLLLAEIAFDGRVPMPAVADRSHAALAAFGAR